MPRRIRLHSIDEARLGVEYVCWRQRNRHEKRCIDLFVLLVSDAHVDVIQVTRVEVTALHSEAIFRVGYYRSI